MSRADCSVHAAIRFFSGLTHLLFVVHRSAMAPGAEENAQLHGGVGYHYPWESGTSGAEVTPESCPADNPRCHWNRLFVTAGVSYAIRLYYSMTRDYDYMVNTIYAGCDVSREIARFLANQAVFNPEHGRYDMNGTKLHCFVFFFCTRCEPQR